MYVYIYIYKLSIHVHIIYTNIRWYRRSDYINLDIAHNNRTPVPTPPILHNTCQISCPLHLLPTPVYTAHTSRVSFFHFSTWRWPLSSAETCSCSLCNKLYMYLPSYSCDRQVYTLQSTSNKSLFLYVWGSLLPRQYYLYQRLQLQFYVLLTMGAMDARNMYSNLAVNNYLHTVASCWISST